VLEGGEIRELGARDEIIARPGHRYTQALIAAAPSSVEARRGRTPHPSYRFNENGVIAMKISKITTTIVNIRSSRRWRWWAGVEDGWSRCIVEMETDDGLVGWARRSAARRPR